jgi:hypothetical protein
MPTRGLSCQASTYHPVRENQLLRTGNRLTQGKFGDFRDISHDRRRPHGPLLEWHPSAVDQRRTFNAQEDGAGRRHTLTWASGARLVAPSCSTDRFQHRIHSPHGSSRNLPQSPRQSMSCLWATPRRLTCRSWQRPRPHRSILQVLARMFWTSFFLNFPISILIADADMGQ